MSMLDNKTISLNNSERVVSSRLELPTKRVDITSKLSIFPSEAIALQEIKDSYLRVISGSISWRKYTLRNVYFLIEPGLDGVTILDDSRIVEQSVKFLRKREVNPAYFEKKKLRDDRIELSNLEFDNVFLGFDSGWCNYCHWLMFTLPIMKIASDIFGEESMSFPIPDYDNFKLSNRKAPISDEVYYKGLKDYKLRKVVNPLTPGKYFARKVTFLKPTFAGTNGFRDILFTSTYWRLINMQRRKWISLRPRRIYLSRGDVSNKRGLDHYDRKIFESLIPYGFERVDIGGMSFNQQKKLMSNAEIVAGIHGAALTNCIFMKQGSQLIEFTNLIGKEKFARPHFFNLATVKNINYGIFLYSENTTKNDLDNWLNSTIN